MSPGKQITRVTLFKIPDPEKQEKLANIYKEMPTKAKKDGKPYIISVNAGPTFEDQRNQGYTLAAISTFASLEDMKYYDTGCEAHNALKMEARKMHQGMLMVYYESMA